MTEDELHITQEGGPTTTVYLSPEQGQALKELLEKNINCRGLTSYCHQIGMHYPNIANMLSGRKKVSMKTLQRLFSKAPFEVECRVEFLIRKEGTHHAIDADLQTLDDILFLEELEDAPEEQ